MSRTVWDQLPLTEAANPANGALPLRLVRWETT